MIRWILRLVANAGIFILVSRYVPGFHVDNWQVAIIAALVFGVVNATIRPLLVLVTLPASLLTLGLFTLVIDAAVMGLCAFLVPGFGIDGFVAALIGWLVVATGAVITGWVFKK